MEPPPWECFHFVTDKVPAATAAPANTTTTSTTTTPPTFRETTISSEMSIAIAVDSTVTPRSLEVDEDFVLAVETSVAKAMSVTPGEISPWDVFVEGFAFNGTDSGGGGVEGRRLMGGPGSSSLPGAAEFFGKNSLAGPRVFNIMRKDIIKDRGGSFGERTRTSQSGNSKKDLRRLSSADPSFQARVLQFQYAIILPPEISNTTIQRIKKASTPGTHEMTNFVSTFKTYLSEEILMRNSLHSKISPTLGAVSVDQQPQEATEVVAGPVDGGDETATGQGGDGTGAPPGSEGITTTTPTPGGTTPVIDIMTSPTAWVTWGGNRLAYPHRTGFRPVSMSPCHVRCTVSCRIMHSVSSPMHSVLSDMHLS